MFRTPGRQLAPSSHTTNPVSFEEVRLTTTESVEERLLPFRSRVDPKLIDAVSQLGLDGNTVNQEASHEGTGHDDHEQSVYTYHVVSRTGTPLAVSRWCTVWGVIGKTDEHKKVRNNGVSAGAIGRIVSALAVAGAGLIAVLPQPTSLIWQASVLLSGWGHWLALLSLLLLPGWRRSWADATGSVMACVGILLLVSPLARAYTLNDTLPADLDRAFGPPVLSASTDAPARPAPLVLTDLAFGIQGTDVIVDEHVYDAADSDDLTLDLYRPAFAQGSLPVVIMIHGGGWTGGDKRELPDLNRYLASRGYVVASIGYRLAPRWTFPAPQEDLTAAIRYVKDLAVTHSLDPERIALIGRSAGGQIALLAAYSSGDPAIRGVVSFYGPTALRWGYNNPAKEGIIDSSELLELYLGGPPETHAPQYDAAEPSRFVSASAPPTLLIYGLRDEHVSPFHAEFVSAPLMEAGVPHFVLQMPWAAHGCDYVFSGPCGQVSTFAVERFLDTVLHTEE